MFESYHPLINVIYFTGILVLLLFCDNPVILALWILFSILFLSCHRKKTEICKIITGILILICGMACINPMISHNGVTILFFIYGKAVTLESAIYGGYIGLLLSSMMLWGSCLNQVISSDKFIYVSGRVMPHLALVISMSMRFIPLFKRKASEIYAYQKINMKKNRPSYMDKLLLGMKTFSIVMTWSFENALDTADSMKSRGYGIRKRTSYSIYRFSLRDAVFLSVFLTAGILILALWKDSGMNVTFYPVFRWPERNIRNILIYCLCGGAAGIPWIFEIKEKIIWNYYRSGI